MKTKDEKRLSTVNFERTGGGRERKRLHEGRGEEGEVRKWSRSRAEEGRKQKIQPLNR